MPGIAIGIKIDKVNESSLPSGGDITIDSTIITIDSEIITIDNDI